MRQFNVLVEHRILGVDGYNVSIDQNPTRSLAEDFEFTRYVIEVQDKAGYPGRPLVR